MTFKFIQYHKSGTPGSTFSTHFFLKRGCHCQQWLDSETPCACAWQSELPRSAWSLSQEFCPLSFSQRLLLPSGIVSRSDCQMLGRCSKSDSNLNFAVWPTGCKLKTFYELSSAPKSLNKLWRVWIVFRSVEDAQFQSSSCRLMSMLSLSLHYYQLLPHYYKRDS